MALPGVPSLGFVEMRKINTNPPGINPAYVVTLGACTRGGGGGYTLSRESWGCT